jgi:hypothetical protein
VRQIYLEKKVLEICLVSKLVQHVSIEETVMAFEKVFGKGGRFGKATDELAQTFTGTLSMIGDKVFAFKKTLLDAGFFSQVLKRQFGAFR